MVRIEEAVMEVDDVIQEEDEEEVEDEEPAAAEIILYEGRLQTFGEKGLWFEIGTASRQNMAKSGFFCPNEDLRKKRIVCCTYCRHEFQNWARDDIPQERHLKESPECPFAAINKEEGELTIQQIIELELFTKLKGMEEEKERMKAKVLTSLAEVEKLMKSK